MITLLVAALLSFVNSLATLLRLCGVALVVPLDGVLAILAQFGDLDDRTQPHAGYPRAPWRPRPRESRSQTRCERAPRGAHGRCPSFSFP